MNLSRNTQSHRLVLLYFHATVILYNNMSELLGKRGIYHSVFLGKVFFLNHLRGKNPISKSDNQADAYVSVF